MNNRLLRYIKSAGSISVADFIAISSSCGGGYYQNRQCFTADFVTSPEITPLFGHVIGLELLQIWQRSFAGQKVCLMELGPGSGIMMRDILRSFRINAANLLQDIEVCMIEISNSLASVQQETLKDYLSIITWHKSMPDTNGKPLLLVANEFFDALPIYQYQLCTDGWRELRIAPIDNRLEFIQGPLTKNIAYDMLNETCSIGDIIETSPASIAFMRTIASDIATVGGYALIFDYGYEKSKFCSTLRAIKAHAIVDTLNSEGADISADVDFCALAQTARQFNVSVSVSSQRDKLTDLGLQNVLEIAGGNEIIYNKLMCDMGETFKVLSLCGAIDKSA